MTYRCNNHPNDQPCPVKMGQEAADVIRQARSDADAAKIACEAMRMISRFAGVKLPDAIEHAAAEGVR